MLSTRLPDAVLTVVLALLVAGVPTIGVGTAGSGAATRADGTGAEKMPALLIRERRWETALTWAISGPLWAGSWIIAIIPLRASISPRIAANSPRRFMALAT